MEKPSHEFPKHTQHLMRRWRIRSIRPLLSRRREMQMDTHTSYGWSDWFFKKFYGTRSLIATLGFGGKGGCMLRVSAGQHGHASRVLHQKSLSEQRRMEQRLRWALMKDAPMGWKIIGSFSSIETQLWADAYLRFVSSSYAVMWLMRSKGYGDNSGILSDLSECRRRRGALPVGS